MRLRHTWNTTFFGWESVIEKKTVKIDNICSFENILIFDFSYIDSKCDPECGNITTAILPLVIHKHTLKNTFITNLKGHWSCFFRLYDTCIYSELWMLKQRKSWRKKCVICNAHEHSSEHKERCRGNYNST